MFRPRLVPGRVIAREHRAQHAPRIPREGVVFREPPDKAGGPVFRAQRRVTQPQSLSGQQRIIPQFEVAGIGPKRPLFYGVFSVPLRETHRSFLGYPSSVGGQRAARRAVRLQNAAASLSHCIGRQIVCCS